MDSSSMKKELECCTNKFQNKIIKYQNICVEKFLTLPDNESTKKCFEEIIKMNQEFTDKLENFIKKCFKIQADDNNELLKKTSSTATLKNFCWKKPHKSE